jgi:hypothetical protein
MKFEKLFNYTKEYLNVTLLDESFQKEHEVIFEGKPGQRHTMIYGDDETLGEKFVESLIKFDFGDWSVVDTAVRHSGREVEFYRFTKEEKAYINMAVKHIRYHLSKCKDEECSTSITRVYEPTSVCWFDSGIKFVDFGDWEVTSFSKSLHWNSVTLTKKP